MHLYQTGSAEAEGWDAAKREMVADRWTPDTARRYLATCGECGAAEPKSEYDVGFMAAVRALAGVQS